VWSLDPSLKIQNFTFQRCRARKRTAIESDQFKKQLKGKWRGELRALLASDGTTLRPGGLSVPAGSEDLVAIVVRSALKTISVTELDWARDLKIISPVYFARREFKEAVKLNRFRIRTEVKFAKTFSSNSPKLVNWPFNATM